MKLKPVYKCRFGGCGRTVIVQHLATFRADEDTELLRGMMANLHKVALCDWHRRQRNWYATQGRDAEWEQMAARSGLLIVVRDPEKDQDGEHRAPLAQERN